jgi:hypothetical protein
MDDETLDRELQTLMAVDPSPGFRARVLERAGAEPARGGWSLRWTLAVVGAAAVAVLALVLPSRLAPPVSAPELAAHHLSLPLAVGPAVTPARREMTIALPQPAAATTPSISAGAGAQVIVYAPEAAAWRRLLSGVGTGRIDRAQLALLDPEPAPAEIPVDFALPPVVIVPVMPALPDEGAHQ